MRADCIFSCPRVTTHLYLRAKPLWVTLATDMTLNDDEIPRHEMSQPGDIAQLVETVLMLPNNASASELLIHCQFEPML
jgi:hypothetical protein